LRRLDAEVHRNPPICANRVMHADVKIVHSIPIGFDVLEPPQRRVDSRKKVDVHVSRMRVITSPALHFERDTNVDGNDRRLQAGSEMERAFIEWSNLTGRDTFAFRAQEY